MLNIGSVHCAEYEIEASRISAVVAAEAPGRVHLLGEHGEPHAGLYLSAAIDKRMQVSVSSRKDSSLRFYAPDLGERKRTTLVNLKFKREDRWANYIKVAIQVFGDLGYPVKGLNFTVAGNVPQQIGLASSTAVEIAAATALRGFFHCNISEIDLINRLTEVHAAYFGKIPVVADYLVCFYARNDQLLLIDETTLEVRKIKFPFTRYKFFILDSRVPRLGVEDELKQRWHDIKRGRDLLSHRRKEASLREFAPTDLLESTGNLPEVIRRRSMHVVQEIRRVYDAEEALMRSDVQSFSKLIFHSHESLRDLYEVSCPETDWLVKRAQESEGTLGSRMTGLGFGGCVYAMIHSNAVEDYKRRLEDYERIFGFRPVMYEVKISTGKRLIPS